SVSSSASPGRRPRIMGTRARRLTVLLAVCTVVVVGVANAAFGTGITITDPATNPFVTTSIGDLAGTPDFFTVTATGLPATGTADVMECDGVAPASANWSANDHCDAATGNTGVTITNNSATFPADDHQHRLSANKLKGESPQSKFNCLGP